MISIILMMKDKQKNKPMLQPFAHISILYTN